MISALRIGCGGFGVLGLVYRVYRDAGGYNLGFRV